MHNNAVPMYRSAEVVPGIWKQCPPKISHVIHALQGEIYEIMLCLVCTTTSFLSLTSNISSVSMQIFDRGVKILELSILL